MSPACPTLIPNYQRRQRKMQMPNYGWVNVCFDGQSCLAPFRAAESLREQGLEILDPPLTAFCPSSGAIQGISC